MKKNRKFTNTVAENKLLPSPIELVLMVSTFMLVVVAWVFFRADSISEAFSYFSIIFKDIITTPNFNGQNSTFITIIIMIVFEWVHRNKEFGLEISWIKTKTIRLVIYSFILTSIFIFGGKSETFIYFQF